MGEDVLVPLAEATYAYEIGMTVAGRTERLDPLSDPQPASDLLGANDFRCETLGERPRLVAVDAGVAVPFWSAIENAPVVPHRVSLALGRRMNDHYSHLVELVPPIE